MKKIIYPSAALLTAFALLSVQTAKADTAQVSDQANEPAATVEEVVASPTPENTTENQGGSGRNTDFNRPCRCPCCFSNGNINRDGIS